VSAERAGAFELILPAEYAHWRPALATRLAAVEEACAGLLARWEPDPRLPFAPAPRVIRVCRDPAEAAVLLAALGRRDDPRVPRTLPDRHLALVPLARDDRLLRALAAPPATLLESVAHEAAHLLASDRPTMKSAPAWFQEGLAEACRAVSPGRAAHVSLWPLNAGASLPSEVLLDGWAFWVLTALERDTSQLPWMWVEALSEPDALRIGAAGGAARTPSVRGRDAHADPNAGLWLAASLPGQVVEVDLPPLSPGSTRALSLQLGASGEPDAGLRLCPAEGAAGRLRCDAAGGLAFWIEDLAAPARSHSSDRAASAPDAAPRAFRLEHRGSEIAILADGGFAQRFPLQEAARAYPVALVLYVRDGACVARAQP
jgi:hypothetical protein